MIGSLRLACCAQLRKSFSILQIPHQENNPMAIKKHGSAQWTGNLKEGQGHVSTESGVLQSAPYGFNKRFSDEAGTNPEELIGAAHAACFSMALANIISSEGFEVETLETKAVVSLDKVPDGFAISGVELNLHGVVPGMSDEKFNELAQKAKVGCPVSKALSAIEITLNVTTG
jgi:osmotically inducible protein OsmC